LEIGNIINLRRSVMKLGYSLLAVLPYILIIVIRKLAYLFQLNNTAESMIVGLTVGFSLYAIAKLGLFDKKMNFHAGMAIIIFGPILIFMIDVYLIK
jgi:hypothetical protein